MTKKQAAERKAAWRLAVSEGRVIRYTSYDVVLKCDQCNMVAYPSKVQADETLSVQQARIASGESIYSDARIVIAPIQWA